MVPQFFQPANLHILTPVYSTYFCVSPDGLLQTGVTVIFGNVLPFDIQWGLAHWLTVIFIVFIFEMFVYNKAFYVSLNVTSLNIRIYIHVFSLH